MLKRDFPGSWAIVGDQPAGLECCRPSRAEKSKAMAGWANSMGLNWLSN
jgi:hypothetical protein